MFTSILAATTTAVASNAVACLWESYKYSRVTSAAKALRLPTPASTSSSRPRA